MINFYYWMPDIQIFFYIKVGFTYQWGMRELLRNLSLEDIRCDGQNGW